VQLKTEEFDDANAYNPATSTFTAPSAGLYHFDLSLTFGPNSVNSDVIIELYTGSSAIDYTAQFPTTNSTFNHLSLSTNIKLSAGETVNVQLTNNGSSTFTISAYDIENRFSGYKVY
jgi:hypothetical protein